VRLPYSTWEPGHIWVTLAVSVVYQPGHPVVKIVRDRRVWISRLKSSWTSDRVVDLGPDFERAAELADRLDGLADVVALALDQVHDRIGQRARIGAVDR
jgi:hypothetical protein